MADRESFPTRNDLSQDTRDRSIGLLNQHLADTFDLYSQTKQAHWNVKGSQFYQFHKLFDDLAEMIFPYVDTLAERVTALGGVAMGTARMAAASSRLPECPSGALDGMQCVQELSQRYADVGNSARRAIETAMQIGDQGTADIFIDMVRDFDKALYFLEAHVQQVGASRAGMQKAA